MCDRLLLALFCILLNTGRVFLHVSTGADDCDSFLPETYDRSSPPRHGGEAAKMFIQLEIIDLDEISEATMDFRLHFYIRAVWQDPRISLRTSDLPEECVKDIWIPDLTFVGAKQSSDTGYHNKRFLVQEGYLYLSQRLSFKAVCSMNFQLYPFDTQRCVFPIELMATDDSAAVLRWSDDEENPFRHKMAPILLTRELDALQFVIDTPTTKYNVKRNKFSAVNFTSLLAEFPLQRRLTGSVVNYYMPSALLVIVSWVTFWLREDATAERVALIMTGLLTMCTQVEQYKSELPPVNYITAMDVWYFTCIFMLFATLLEFAFSYDAFRKLNDPSSNRSTSTEISKVDDPKEKGFGSVKMFEKFAPRAVTTKLDSVCKVLFPSFFFTFTVIYWSYYNIAS